MPEYLAPGVYVEETSFRAKSIEGVGTSTTAFVGPTRKGPYRIDEDTQETPELLTSYGDFLRIYGSYADLELSGTASSTNYLAHAVLAFFNEGGSRLYVSRVVSAAATAARAAVTPDTPAAGSVSFVARFPGSLGNATPGRRSIVVREIVSPGSLVTMGTAPVGTLLRTGTDAAPAHHVKIGSTWHPAEAPDADAESAATLAGATPRFVTLQVTATDADGENMSWDDMGFDRSHPRWVGHVLAQAPSRRADFLQNTFAIAIGGSVTAVDLHDALFTNAVVNAQGVRENGFNLSGGLDGAEPTATEYALALGEVAALEDVSIVAAPGASAYTDAQAVNGVLISHAEARRAYRIAVLDTPVEQTPGQIRTLRGLMD